MRREIEVLEFVRGVNFEFDGSLENSDTKHLLVRDDACEQICNRKDCVGFVTAGRHRGLIDFYIRHNLFHQSKLGRDIEQPKTQIVLFKFPRDVMQVSTLSAQLGLGSELVDWYCHATSFPYGPSMIDLLPHSDDRLRYCLNSEFFISRTDWNI